MIELKTLTANELLLSTDAAVNVEKDAISNTTRHFEEVYRRKAYLPAFVSMFEFLTKKYGYCNGSAQIRINAIRLIADVPEVKEKLESGALSLSAAANILSFLAVEKRAERPIAPAAKAELINACVGKSKLEVQKEFVKISPVAEKRDVVRAVDENRVRVNATLTDKAHKNLKQLQDILSHVDPNMSLGDLIERLSEDGLDKYCAKRKAERAKDRAAKKAEKRAADAAKATASKVSEIVASGFETSERNDAGESISSDEIERSRYVPAEERHEVASTYNCCSFVDSSSGQTCGSKKFLQLDHIKPFFEGGESTAGNLRWMCGAHNRWRFENRVH